MEFESLNIPKAEPRSYTDQELAEILKEMMAYYQSNQGKVVGSKNVKVPQLLFALEYEKYLSKTDFNRVYSLAGVNEGNSVAEFGVNLRRLIDIMQPITPVFPFKTVQKIYFGAPGSGKSHKAKEETMGMKVFRTTFHPDTDYASFVGSYKPVLVDGNVRNSEGIIVEGQSEKKIVYEFVPQVFANAYCEAWRAYFQPENKKNVCLLIEELNRGNCAQIFGDLFQLLDRTKRGFSEYSVLPDAAFAKYIKDYLTDDEFKSYYNTIRENSDCIEDQYGIPEWDDTNKENNKVRLSLPPCLSIVCTMNTSDQSLFPMDSAFKRRWDWEYVPIDYFKSESQFIIVVDDGHKYLWSSFLKKINSIIYEQTKSEDKQMGNFFVKGDENFEVDCDQFVSKVMYYLWSEICKDNPKAKRAVFVRDTIALNSDETETATQEDFTFNDLFPSDDAIRTRAEILDGFMSHHGIENCATDIVMFEPSETLGEDVKQRWEHSLYIDELIDYINVTNTDRFKEFKALFSGPYKTHLNGFEVKIEYGGWIGLSRNKDANLVCYGNRDVNKMRKIMSDHGQEIKDDLGIPAVESKVRSDSRWMFTDQQGQAKLATPHKLNRQEEFEWFVESALKVYQVFKKYFPTA